jgi:hypothetical protein
MRDRNNLPDASVPKPDPLSRPKSGSPHFARQFKSYVRNILLANPLFQRFYADVLIDRAPNSNAAKILRNNYSKILEKVNMAVARQQQSQNSRTCTHIKVTGVRCGSPSLRGEQFCYFHQRMYRGVRTPPQARLHPIAMIEDEASVQAALMEVMNALMRNTIDLKRATLILRALHIAVKNIGRVNIQFQGRDGVREIPEYDVPARAQRDAAAAENIADLIIHEPSAAPPTEAPKRIPDPDAGKSRDELLAHYYGYSTVEAYLAGPEAKNHSAARAAKKAAANAVENSTNKRPSTSVKPVPLAQKNKVNGACAG